MCFHAFMHCYICLFYSEMLDGKEVTDTARVFLKNWQANKDAIKRKRETQSRQNEFQGFGGTVPLF